MISILVKTFKNFYFYVIFCFLCIFNQILGFFLENNLRRVCVKLLKTFVVKTYLIWICLILHILVFSFILNEFESAYSNVFSFLIGSSVPIIIPGVFVVAVLVVSTSRPFLNNYKFYAWLMTWMTLMTSYCQSTMIIPRFLVNIPLTTEPNLLT